MLLLFYFTDYNELYPIHKWESENQSILNKYSIKIIYIIGKKFRIELNDKQVFNNMKSFTTFFETTFRPKKTVRLDNFNFCGLQRDANTSHCFADSTHRTCCLLGKDSRKYANESGNPIGKASEDAFFKYYGVRPDENMLTPWCTCMGSKVCSYYQQRFGKRDGTHIKFLNDKKDNIILDRDEQKYSIYNHTTPGIIP
jgi:hypothetical protein